MMISKRGQLGFSVTTIYRVLMLILISAVILGVSSVAYSHRVDVQDIESMILSREIADCLIDKGVVDLTSLRSSDNLFTHCGFDAEKMKLFFALALIKIEGKDDFKIEGGDSNLIWIRDLFGDTKKTDLVTKYKPGYFNIYYEVVVLDGGVKKDGKLFLEVIVNEDKE